MSGEREDSRAQLGAMENPGQRKEPPDEQQACAKGIERGEAVGAAKRDEPAAAVGQDKDEGARHGQNEPSRERR